MRTRSLPAAARAIWVVLALAAAAWAFPAGAAEQGPAFRYCFDTAGDGKSVPNAAGPKLAGRIVGEARVAPVADAAGVTALSLDGKSGCIEVEGSEGLHLGDQGFTVAATVRFADSGGVEGAPDTHDMIVMKPDEYLLGRTRRSLYFNIRDDRDWAAGVTGGECQPNTWVHAAAVVERIYEPPQGRVGYFIRLYLNGEQVAAREVLNNCTAGTTENPVNIGKGWGGPWFFRGEMAHVAVYPRALTDGELNQLLKQEKLAKVVFKRTAEPDPRFPEALAETRAAVAAQPEPRRKALARLLAAAEQSVNHVETQAAVLPYLSTVRRLAKSGRDPLREFAAAHSEFVLLDNGRLALAFYAPRPGRAALCSLFDLAAGREILGEQQAVWSLRYEPPGGGALREMDSMAASLAAKVTVNRAANSALLEWTHPGSDEHPFRFTARSDLRLEGPRLSLGFSVESRSADVALREARFPVIRLRRLEEGTDRLLVPRMSGVLHESPVRTRFQYEGPYPSGAAHLQFFAYYDDRRGVYVACEDPKARSKDLRARGDGNDCEISSLWHVGCRGAGGNGFAASGSAVVEAFRGDWFDAARIYKRFARTAAWWPASRSRADTPAWYREMALWLIGNANTRAAADDLIAFRKEMGLPVGLHWYGWNKEGFDDDYPYFTPRDDFAPTVARLRAEGVYVKPYINARIWETLDRGDKDVTYTSVALPATVKDRQGKPATESYNNRTFSPMCPTTELWQKRMRDLCAQLAGDGVAGIYLDQIGAGRPRICFDPTHPHAAGAGEAWLEQGYWPMLAAIRRELKPKYPELILNTEDAAEPYMHLMDGYLPWRFVDVGHVPAYQSIYAGRVQMTSRHFDDSSYNALFPKAAEQMLYGEQVGWFNIHTVRSNPAFKLFVKKLAHTRRAFLPFFNEGDMLKAPPFTSQMPSVTADWGFYGPRVITTPAVLHSAWRLGGSIAVLFANTSCEPVTARVAPDAAWGLGDGSPAGGTNHRGLGGAQRGRKEGSPPGTSASSAVRYPTPRPLRVVILGEGKEPVVSEWRPGAAMELTMPGYSIAAWLFAAGDPGDAGHAARVKAATELFPLLKGFDDEAGMTPERKRAERDERDPWVVPEAPVRAATEWIPAAAPKRIRVRTAADGSYVTDINAVTALCFGPVDFGAAAGGKAFLECEMAVAPRPASTFIRFWEAQAGRGVPLAEAKLTITGGMDKFETMRIPLPTATAGVKNLVITFSGRAGGIVFRKWRLVREP